ncbi:hypothetical protein GE061_005365 [Apolygus lucorum]|uniref:Uncharacterized protein n=1 Tax=Apolygus lucorum TaxID=248454 RepID=A0A6A4J154_APOLU|nr:hypothetical protein GE061_005365 [Apolygus lucorum]
MADKSANMRDIELTYELANPKGVDRVDRVLNTYKRKGSIENFSINEDEHKIFMRTSLAEPDVCKILKTCTKKVDVIHKEENAVQEAAPPPPAM